MKGRSVMEEAEINLRRPTVRRKRWKAITLQG